MYHAPFTSVGKLGAAPPFKRWASRFVRNAVEEGSLVPRRTDWSSQESRLRAFCMCSLSELVLSPMFLLQIGHTFISGRLCCQSIDTLL
jgi:hypothetical protein